MILNIIMIMAFWYAFDVLEWYLGYAVLSALVVHYILTSIIIFINNYKGKDKNQKKDFHNKNLFDFRNKNQGKCKIFPTKDFRNKKIAVPKMQFWDDELTKPSENLNFPKFEVDVWDNGSLEYLQHLNADGDWDGLAEAWRENGKKWYEQNYVNGNQHGIRTEWYDNGQKEVEVNYVNNARHGLGTYWYENGEKYCEKNWDNGERHGLNTWWHANGQKRSEGNYKNGEKHGEWKFFDKGGKLEKTEIYENGQLVK